MAIYLSRKKGAEPIIPSNASPAQMTANTPVNPTRNGYAIESYNSVTPPEDYFITLQQNDIVKLNALGYITKEFDPITPSNNSPVPFASGKVLHPTASGYAISSYNTVTPSNINPVELSSNNLYKPSTSGYLYRMLQRKVWMGTVTTSTTATTYVNLGFEPEYIAFVNYKDSTHFTLSIYNKDISTGATYRGAVNGTNQNCATFSLPTSTTTTNAAKILSIDSTGFTIDKTSTNFGTNAYYFAIG